MNDYDIYLRHASVSGGAWVGFPLAWKGMVGIAGLEPRPHMRWRPWLLEPSAPNDPTAGTWGIWQWRFDLAMLDGLAGLEGRPPEDGRDANQIRADLLAYMPLPAIELKDVDGAVYTVKMTGYREQLIEPADVAHPNGGWTARVEFAETAEV